MDLDQTCARIFVIAQEAFVRFSSDWIRFNMLISLTSPCRRADFLPRRANVLEREDFHALNETLRLKR